MLKTVLFQAIQFSISTQFSSVWLIDMTLSGATTLAQSGPGTGGNKGVLCIPQSSSITDISWYLFLIYHWGMLSIYVIVIGKGINI